MGQGRPLLFGLLVGLLAGCTSDKPGRSTSWLARSPIQGLAGRDIVRMDVALIERPIDDNYLGSEVWKLADEQVVSLERKGLLEENGFRVGQIGGLKPAALQTLLTSERSCANPRRFFVHAGKPAPLALGPAITALRFQLNLEGLASSVALEQASCFLQVEPNVGNDGQIRLLFTPQLQHGETKLSAQPAEDNSGFVLQAERPKQAFPTLAWEVTLAPNQYLIVGARVDQPESLGYQCFLRRGEVVPVQRLLVIRACRADSSPESDTSLASDEEANLSRTPSLALQANQSKTASSEE